MANMLQLKLVNFGKIFSNNKFILNTCKNAIRKSNVIKLNTLNQFKVSLKLSKPKLLLGSSVGIGLTGLCYYNRENILKLDELDLKNLFKSLCGLFITFAECEAKTKQKRRRTDHYEKSVDSKENIERSQDEEKFDWKEFLKLIYDEKFLFILAIISAFGVAMLNIQIPQDLGNLINGVYKMLQSNVKDYYESIYKPSLKLINLYLAQSVLTFSYIYWLGIMGENISSKLKVRLFSKLITQDISFYDKTRTGELIDRLTSDIQEFKSSFKSCISQGLKSSTQIIGCCVSLFLISPKLTLISSVVLPSAVLIGTLFGNMLRKYSKQAQAQIAKSTAVADEALGII